jgi:zona occludens toxin (predicted ATPase)
MSPSFATSPLPKWILDSLIRFNFETDPEESNCCAYLAKSPSADSCFASPEAAAAATAANKFAGSPAAINPAKFKLDDSATAFNRSFISIGTYFFNQQKVIIEIISSF